MRLLVSTIAVALAALTGGCASDPASALVMSHASDRSIRGTSTAADGASWSIQGRIDTSGPQFTVARDGQAVLQTIVVAPNEIDVLVSGASLAQAIAGDATAREVVTRTVDGATGADLQALLDDMEGQTRTDPSTAHWAGFSAQLRDWLADGPSAGAGDVGYGMVCHYCTDALAFFCGCTVCLTCKETK